jgi:hypothetical protein
MSAADGAGTEARTGDAGERAPGELATGLPLVVAITGASGAPYAVRLVEALAAAGRPVWLIVSSHGWRLLDTESAIGSLEALRAQGGCRAVGPLGDGL